jgi:hypothetical protein
MVHESVLSSSYRLGARIVLALPLLFIATTEQNGAGTGPGHGAPRPADGVTDRVYGHSVGASDDDATRRW